MKKRPFGHVLEGSLCNSLERPGVVDRVSGFGIGLPKIEEKKVEVSASVLC